MNAKIAFLASVVLCGSATAEPGKYAHPELRLAAERLESEVTNTAPSISEQDEGTKAVAELPRIEATTDEKANAPQPDQIEPTGDEETNLPALLANTSAVAEVSSSWEAGASGLIAGVLAIVLRACAAVILRRDNRIACTIRTGAATSRNIYRSPGSPHDRACAIAGRGPCEDRGN